MTDNIYNLVERYLDGETTIEEECWLYGYFTSHDDIPDELKPYAEYFRDMATVPIPKEEETVSHRKYHVIRLVLATAAMLAIVFGVFLGFRVHENRILAARYGGSYIIVNGHRIDNLRQIKDSIQLTLAEASRIEQKVQENNVVDDAEQDVLQNVDPAQRKDIEQLLNGQ